MWFQFFSAPSQWVESVAPLLLRSHSSAPYSPPNLWPLLDPRSCERARGVCSSVETWLVIYPRTGTLGLATPPWTLRVWLISEEASRSQAPSSVDRCGGHAVSEIPQGHGTNEESSSQGILEIPVWHCNINVHHWYLTLISCAVM